MSLRIFLSISLLWLFASTLVIAQLPERPSDKVTYINDFTNTIPADKVKVLERKLVEYNKKTNHQLVAVMINRLPAGMTVETAAQKLFSSWGIGQAKDDNGVLLLLAKSDRKLRIEVGYGLEAEITDYSADQVIKKKIVPGLKRDDYYAAISAGMEELIRLASPKKVTKKTSSSTTSSSSRSSNNETSGRTILTLGIVFGIFGLLIFIGKKLVDKENEKYIKDAKANLNNWDTLFKPLLGEWTEKSVKELQSSAIQKFKQAKKRHQVEFAKATDLLNALFSDLSKILEKRSDFVLQTYYKSFQSEKKQFEKLHADYFQTFFDGNLKRYAASKEERLVGQDLKDYELLTGQLAVIFDEEYLKMYKVLNRKLSKKAWDEKVKIFKDLDALAQKHKEFKSEFAAEDTVKDSGKLKVIYGNVNRFLESLEENYALQNHILLERWTKEIDRKEIFSRLEPYCIKEAFREKRAYYKAEPKYFKSKGREELNASDQKRLEEAEFFFKTLLEDEHKALDTQYDLLEKEASKYVERGPAWTKYRSQYTELSISKKARAFEKIILATVRSRNKNKELLEFIEGDLAEFIAAPQYHLSRKSSTLNRNSGFTIGSRGIFSDDNDDDDGGFWSSKRSSSSWSYSDSGGSIFGGGGSSGGSSYSDYSDSSWGGGDSGGGGASGSW